MENKKKVYVNPDVACFSLCSTGIICTSPGGGGSESTGDENLFPVSSFDSFLDLGNIL